jgi:hypothetical protein
VKPRSRDLVDGPLLELQHDTTEKIRHYGYNLLGTRARFRLLRLFQDVEQKDDLAR